MILLPYYDKLIDLCTFINRSTLCAGHDTCRRRSEQDSVEVESSVIKSFSSLWSTKMTSTTENHVWKKNKKPVHRRKAVSFDWGLSYETIRFFCLFVSAIFKVFKLETRYLIFQSVYGLWSSAKMKQFKEIISYCSSF